MNLLPEIISGTIEVQLICHIGMSVSLLCDAATSETVSEPLVGGERELATALVSPPSHKYDLELEDAWQIWNCRDCYLQTQLFRGGGHLMHSAMDGVHHL